MWEHLQIVCIKLRQNETLRILALGIVKKHYHSKFLLKIIRIEGKEYFINILVWDRINWYNNELD